MFRITIEADNLWDLGAKVIEAADQVRQDLRPEPGEMEQETPDVPADSNSDTPPPPPPVLSPVPGADTSGDVPPPPPDESPLPPPPAVPGTAATADESLELDSEGLPHDLRIHSKAPTKNVNTGKWRAKRGVDAATIGTVVAELRATYPVPSPELPGPAKPLYDANADAPPPPDAPPVPAPDADASIVVTVMDCLSIMMTNAGSDPRVKAMGVEVNTLMTRLGLPNNALSLHENPDKIPATIEGLKHIAERYEISQLVTFPEVGV